ncbi:MAG: hypothetical protein WCK51_14425 [Armatimonadota bacterium]
MKTRFEKEPVVTDDMLASQASVKQLVAGLKDDSLSMAWRSELNLKLLAAADKRKKAIRFRRFATWGSSLGLAAVAGSFAMVMFQPVSPVRGSGSEASGIAREFVQVHNESSVLASVSGTGINQRETELGLEVGYSYEDML